MCGKCFDLLKIVPVTSIYLEPRVQHLTISNYVSAAAGRLRLPRLRCYGRIGRRTDCKISSLRRATKYGPERPTLLEETTQVRVGRSSLRSCRKTFEKYVFVGRINPSGEGAGGTHNSRRLVSCVTKVSRLSWTKHGTVWNFQWIAWTKKKKERLSRVVRRERGDWYFLRFNGYVNVGWN